MTNGTRQSGPEAEALAPAYASPLDDPARYDSPLLDIDLRYLLTLVRRNLLWIAAIIGATLLAGLLITILTVPKYVASSKILVEDQTAEIIEGGELTDTSGNAWDIERFLRTQMDMIRSRTLAERVVEAEKLANDADFFAAMGAALPDETMLEGRFRGKDGLARFRKFRAINLLADGLAVGLSSDSRIIEISFESNDPAYSAKIANAFAANFVEANLNRKFDSSAYAREFLSEQLQQARERLEASERELNQYSRSAGLVRVSGRGQDSGEEGTLSITDEALVQANAAASQAAAARIAAEQRWQSVARQPVLSISSVLENSAIQNLLTQKSKLEADLAQERARHLGGHPTVQGLVAQVNELDQRIETIGRSIKESIRLEYNAARENERMLESRVAQLRLSALSEQDRGVQYNVLKRVADTNRALYDALLERYNALSAASGASSNNIALVEVAEIPTEPSSPVLILNILISLILGGLLATVFVFVREHFDDTVREPADVEQKLGLPLLGLVPVVDDTDMTEALLDGKSNVSEAYHSLVTNLRYSTPTGFPRSLLVTSAGPSEGKTTTAHAIALDLARLGKNVLLVDGDLRRPTLHHRIEDGRNRKGFTDLLTGQASLDDVLIPADQENLTYMTAMPKPPEPSLLLASDRLGHVVQEFTSRFEIVIIDSPPMLGISDTASLASATEAVLMVVDGSEFHRGAVKSTTRRLELIRANVIGVVLTKYNPKAGGDYGYYGYYYYSYGDDQPAKA
jgi:polysaccharide biosynthesis transport protein